MKKQRMRLLLCVLVIALLFSGLHITAAARGKADSGQTEPAATEPAETSGAKGREEGKKVESESDETDEEETQIFIWGALGAAAVAVIAIVAIRKNKEKQTYNSPASSFENSPSPVILNDHGNQETDLWVPDSDSYAAPVSSPGGLNSLYLYMEEGALKGKRYRITEKMLTLGRDYTCDVHFPAETKGVSRRHCQLCLKNGGVVIVDLGSSSGTFIRGDGRLSPNIPRELREGDTIYLGSKQQTLKIIRK